MPDDQDLTEVPPELNEWQVAGIREALEASKAGEEPIEHEKVSAWLRSWGTDRELPPAR